jgi:hypothetical protein
MYLFAERLCSFREMIYAHGRSEEKQKESGCAEYEYILEWETKSILNLHQYVFIL